MLPLLSIASAYAVYLSRLYNQSKRAQDSKAMHMLTTLLPPFVMTSTIAYDSQCPCSKRIFVL